MTWLHQHPDASAWPLRQLPVPGMHTKWLDTPGALLREVAGRDVRDEVRPRLTVTHLTYVDPDHAASGRRRHDAWTTGDVHDIAYQPRVVLVVENRDSRLWFPPVRDTIVVEGGGKAASALLANVPWIRAADHVVYWGDIDATGMESLTNSALRSLRPHRMVHRRDRSAPCSWTPPTCTTTPSTASTTISRAAPSSHHRRSCHI
ncbi:Wadjet anti-phage system protein JetD domain-containing protein [Amycolatopsis sp. YIM 10]|uniref:Wadjet anti-phage system protein JetD domain-containing protein n=1 Tax=Amycolatopsis sp. YIM 10 TaxID=2653857 RepID=UPI002104A5FF|nr:Wadjet anti-phage system protein JetD domain-containing protein [Amycolatopsis sp. YIM 10]